MSSKQQIVANRLNAQRSTGPRTAEGKAKVSANALKHGLTARDVVLPIDASDEFDAFRAGLLASLNPQGALEAVFAEKIVLDLWRLRRVPIFEATYYRQGFAELLASQERQEIAAKERESSLVWEHGAMEKERILAALRRKKRERHFLPESAEQRSERMQTQREEHFTRRLETFPEPFLNLWRHESALTRYLHKNMHELERLQAKRAGQHVPVPEVVDVDVNVSETSRPDIEGTGPNGETNANRQ